MIMRNERKLESLFERNVMTPFPWSMRDLIVVVHVLGGVDAHKFTRPSAARHVHRSNQKYITGSFCGSWWSSCAGSISPCAHCAVELKCVEYAYSCLVVCAQAAT